MGRSLKFRILIPSLAVLILFGSAYSYFWTSHLSRETNRAFMLNGQRAVQSIAIPVATGIWEFDEAAVKSDLAALESWDGFAFAQVVDASGTFASYPANPDLPIGWAAFLEPDALTASSIKDFGMQHAFVAPLQHAEHGTIGHVVAVFSYDELGAKLDGINSEAATYAVLATLIFSFVLYCVASSVTRPVSRVTAQIEQAAESNVEIHPADIARVDEVGRLASAVELFSLNSAELVSVKAKAEAAEAVAQMALIDPLTSLANRRGLDEAFEAISIPTGNGLFAFISVDLDDFKQVNDMHGHAIGDAVLKVAAERMRCCICDAIALARTGGDEFLVLIAVASRDDALETARIIVAKIMEPIDLGAVRCQVGASAGIDLQPYDAFAAEQGMLNSDQALYRAKSREKGSVILYDVSVGEQIRSRNDTAEQIRTSLENGDFIPFFQPQVDTTTLEVVGAEVLARWDTGDGKILPPGAFLPIADELHLTSQIDKIVAEKAISIFRGLSESGVVVPSLSINVSGKRLREPGLIDMLRCATARGLKINVELVEATFLDDADEKTLFILDQLREFGVGIEIDDFGTGHASIAGLMRLGPDTIKIDRQFIQPIRHGAKARKLVKVFVEMARTFNMDVVAEGVESLDDVPLMQQIGIQRLQGYAFARPLPADEFEGFLRNNRVSEPSFSEPLAAAG